MIHKKFEKKKKLCSSCTSVKKSTYLRSNTYIKKINVVIVTLVVSALKALRNLKDHNPQLKDINASKKFRIGN